MWLLMLCGWLCVGVVCENWRVDASIDTCACMPVGVCVCVVCFFLCFVCVFLGRTVDALAC